MLGMAEPGQTLGHLLLDCHGSEKQTSILFLHMYWVGQKVCLGLHDLWRNLNELFGQPTIFVVVTLWLRW